jgi:hypothetical protein
MKMGQKRESVARAENLQRNATCRFFLKHKQFLPALAHDKKSGCTGIDPLAGRMLKSCLGSLQNVKDGSEKMQDRLDASYAKAESLWKHGW